MEVCINPKFHDITSSILYISEAIIVKTYGIATNIVLFKFFLLHGEVKHENHNSLYMNVCVDTQRHSCRIGYYICSVNNYFVSYLTILQG